MVRVLEKGIPMHRLLVVVFSLLCAGPLLAAQDATYHYQGEIILDEHSGHLDASWTITVLDPALESATFLIRGTLGEVEVSGEDDRFLRLCFSQPSLEELEQVGARLAAACADVAARVEEGAEAEEGAEVVAAAAARL